MRELLYREQNDGADEDMEDVGDAEPGEEGEEEVGEFYTEGTAELLDARRKIARYSLPRAAQRTQFQRQESTIPVETHVAHRKHLKSKLAQFELVGSQIASERPVSMLRFAPAGDVVACGDWGGSVKILDVETLETKRVLRGHKGMVGGIAWKPDHLNLSAQISDNDNDNETSSTLDLASGGGEGAINLWTLTLETPLATLTGHAARVVRTEFHPSASYLASASYDTTFRLWDLQTQQTLLVQEGHSKEVYTVAFSPEGSLLASAGLDSIGRIWDLRTGRTVMLLEGHVGPVHALDWAPEGTRVVSGSADGFAKVWDLRAVREVASLGAHRGGVADLRWFKGLDGPFSGKPLKSKDVEMADTDKETTDAESEPDSRGLRAGLQPKVSGTFLLTAGFDSKVNIFSADDWSLSRSLTGHDGTVLAVDVTSGGEWIGSCGRDRSVKIWGRGDGEGVY